MGDKKIMLCKFIGAKIRYYRTISGIAQHGLSQEELARRSNLHPDTISRIERGNYNDSIPLTTLVDIADGLGIDVQLLITITEVEKQLMNWK
jgi:transcriptional regulator with XRE-family HTH domain